MGKRGTTDLDSLLRVADDLSLDVLVSVPLHVPAHALVEAGVESSQVRRGLTVAERLHPQGAELTLTDAEVRQAGDTD